MKHGSETCSPPLLSSIRVHIYTRDTNFSFRRTTTQETELVHCSRSIRFFLRQQSRRSSNDAFPRPHLSSRRRPQAGAHKLPVSAAIDCKAASRHCCCCCAIATLTHPAVHQIYAYSSSPLLSNSPPAAVASPHDMDVSLFFLRSMFHFSLFSATRVQTLASRMLGFQVFRVDLSLIWQHVLKRIRSSSLRVDIEGFAMVAVCWPCS